MSSDSGATTEAVKRTAADIRRDIDATRRELAETLDALEYKLDVPARMGEWVDDRKAQARRVWSENAGTVIGTAVGTIAAIGAIIAGAIILPRRGR